MQNLNVDPKTLFGSDLTAVFGPPAEREHVRAFTQQELKERLAIVPEYVSTDSLGDNPTLFEITNLILFVLQRTRALHGIDLDWQYSLKETGLRRPAEVYKQVSNVVKNNKAQRGIQLRHLVRDILFKFNPEWVQTGLARYSEVEDRYYLNDAQHRFIGCIILGIREIPLEYKISEFRSVDVQQYTSVNLLSLVASDFDKYRTMVETVRISELEGNPVTDPDFNAAWGVFNILQNHGCKLIEKSGENKAGTLECTGAGNLLRHHADYGSEIFTRAIAINATVFHKTHISTPNIWGICEFIKRQQDEGVMSGNELMMDIAIIDAIMHRYPDGNRNGFYLDAKRAVETGTNKEINIQYQDMVAAGIEKMIKVVHPEVKWKGIKAHGKNIAEKYMDTFKVMPKKVSKKRNETSIFEMA
jgi:hypothetical protein